MWLYSGTNHASIQLANLQEAWKRGRWKRNFVACIGQFWFIVRPEPNKNKKAELIATPECMKSLGLSGGRGKAESKDKVRDVLKERVISAR